MPLHCAAIGPKFLNVQDLSLSNPVVCRGRHKFTVDSAGVKSALRFRNSIAATGFGTPAWFTVGKQQLPGIFSID